MWQLWDSFSHVGGIRWRGQPEIWSYGVFTPMVFSLFKSNSGLFSSLLWLDCAGVNTVITVLLKIKPRGVSLWCERDPTAFWTDYHAGVWYGGTTTTLEGKMQHAELTNDRRRSLGALGSLRRTAWSLSKRFRCSDLLSRSSTVWFSRLFLVFVSPQSMRSWRRCSENSKHTIHTAL